jgi:asparagine synthase (glutamine-hydrolysing)
MAMSLTGGLDSRMIMAWAKTSSSKLICYSNRGMFNECEDVRIGRRVAATCGLPHHVIQVGKEFFAEFPVLAMRTTYLTDGLMDVSGSAGLYANRLARNLAAIRMTGNYGGEILRALVMLAPAKLRNRYFVPDFTAAIDLSVKTLAEESRVHRASFIAFKQVPWHHYSRFALESSQWTVRSPYLDNELVALAYQAPNDVRANQYMAERLITDGNPALVAFPTDRGPLGRQGVLGRLGERYQEFTFKADYAYDYGMPQWLTNIDRLLSPLQLERLFLGRHKYNHFRIWYRNQLAPFVKSVLLDSRSLTRPYVDRHRVESMVSAHVTGRGNYTLEITSLLTAELMQRQLIESI